MLICQNFKREQLGGILRAYHWNAVVWTRVWCVTLRCVVDLHTERRWEPGRSSLIRGGPEISTSAAVLYAPNTRVGT